MAIDPNWQNQHFGNRSAATKLPEPIRRRRWPWLLGGVLVVILGLGAAFVAGVLDQTIVDGMAWIQGVKTRAPKTSGTAPAMETAALPDHPAVVAPTTGHPPVAEPIQPVDHRGALFSSPPPADPVPDHGGGSPADRGTEPTDLHSVAPAAKVPPQQEASLRRGLELQTRELGKFQAKSDKAAFDLNDAQMSQLAALQVARRSPNLSGLTPDQLMTVGRYNTLYTNQLSAIQRGQQEQWLGVLLNNCDALVRSCRQRLNDAENAKAVEARRIESTLRQLQSP